MRTLRSVTGLATSLLLLGACQPREVEVAPPVEREPAGAEPAVQPAPAAVAVAPAEVQFESAFPVTAEDIGDLMVASGTVVGKPGPTGFFLRTAGNRVVFVQSAVPVTIGQHVSVAGPLDAAEVTLFDGWERESLGDLGPDWDLLRLYYIRANAVTFEVELGTAFPITAEDVGDLMAATGTVVGKPGPAGFFLRTDGNRVVFVQSSTPVALGQRVRVAGPLQAAAAALFDGWQRDALGNAEPDWDLLRLYYIRAASVAVQP